MLTWEGFRSAQTNVTYKDIVAGALHVLLLVVVVFAFLRVRKINVTELFGFRSQSLFKATGFAAGLIIAAFPLMLCVGALAQQLMGARAEEQELVQFFTRAASRHDFMRVILTMMFGVLLAPAAEEFIFRGYIYGTLKKYTGLVPALVFTSLLFAAIHVNLSSLPGLFVLAVCLTVAYETTGSLLVAMAMHALFNLSEFCMMLATAQ